ncbi:MAG: pyruvate kinase [Spirochaetota bacterium]
MKFTKIICTAGPSTSRYSTLLKIAKKGMDVVRINMSHGSHDVHLQIIQSTRKVSEKLVKYIGIIMDLQGPKIRIGNLAGERVILREGERLTLTSRQVSGNTQEISIDYPLLPREVRTGERILVDDGNIELKVVGTDTDNIYCRIINGGELKSHKGVNLPHTRITASSITSKDMQDLEFGIEQGVDFFALSFVREAREVEELKQMIQNRGANIPVIAKIEKPEAIKNIDHIIRAADGIMVARGDLGAETSPQDVPIFQKMIIKKCNQEGKPVITATQMLESMMEHPRPTRAEANDVANAIFDGTDAVMLSGETAVGKYPLQAVQVMADIANRTEKEVLKASAGKAAAWQECPDTGSDAESVCYAACKMTSTMKAKLIVAFTLSGRTAFLASRFRPSVPIIAMSPDVQVLRTLSLYWGVHAVYVDRVDTAEKLLSMAEKILTGKKLCREGDVVIVVGGVPVLAGEPANMLKVHRVSLEEENI